MRGRPAARAGRADPAALRPGAAREGGGRRLAALAVSSMFAAATLGLPARAAEAIGVRTEAVEAQGRSLDVRLWYPAAEGGTPARIGDGAVFEGVAAREGAPVAEGTFPLVLVSHGGLRAAPDLAGWISSRLAARGIVAAVVRPPRLGPDDAGRAVAEIWKRPADLAATLTALLDDPEWSGHIDLSRIGALGFFLGGTSVLALAGARLDPGRFARSCDQPPSGMDCGWLGASGVDLRATDARALGGARHDPRVRVAVAVDPELTASLSTASLPAIAVPVEIINLGPAGAIPPGLDASALAATAPLLHYATAPAAGRFSAFPVCKPNAGAILAEEGEDDAICREQGDRSREEIHADLAAMIIAGLGRGFAIHD